MGPAAAVGGAPEHVACVPGDAFGPSGAGFVRCSYATSLENVTEAVRRITAFAGRKVAARAAS